MSETLTAPLAEFLADRIPKAAAKAHQRFKTVPQEDFEAAMWLKVYAGKAKFEDLYGQDKQGAIWAELRREGTKVGQEDRRYREAVRAVADGYSVYDIEFYTPAMLAVILPALVEADFDVSVAMGKAAAGTDAAGVHIRSSDPFGGAENYLVVLIDITTAYRRLPLGMQRLLKTYYAVSQEDTQDGRWAREGLASSMGLTSHALQERVRRARVRLADELGGADPWK